MQESVIPIPHLLLCLTKLHSYGAYFTCEDEGSIFLQKSGCIDHIHTVPAQFLALSFKKVKGRLMIYFNCSIIFHFNKVKLLNN
jgi:hypothetical protein